MEQTKKWSSKYTSGTYMYMYNLLQVYIKYFNVTSICNCEIIQICNDWTFMDFVGFPHQKN